MVDLNDTADVMSFVAITTSVRLETGAILTPVTICEKENNYELWSTNDCSQR